MNRTVHVSTNILVHHELFRKDFLKPHNVLVHDPNNLLVEGDVVSYGLFPPGLRAKRDRRGTVVQRRKRPRDKNMMMKVKGVEFMVREIITPFGVPLEKRRPRKVGSEAGKWKGSDGEVKRVTIRKRVGKKKAGGAGAKVVVGQGRSDGVGVKRQRGPGTNMGKGPDGLGGQGKGRYKQAGTGSDERVKVIT
jgi:hypothetical protein